MVRRSAEGDGDWGFEWPPQDQIRVAVTVELDVDVIPGTSKSAGAQPTGAHGAVVSSAIEPALPPRMPLEWREAIGASVPATRSIFAFSFFSVPRSLQRLSARSWVRPALLAVGLIAIAEGAFILATRPRASSSGHAATSQTLSSASTFNALNEGSNSVALAGESAAVATDYLPPKGRLAIRSEPAGAQVFVNGQEYGSTPLTMEDIAVGDHKVVVKYRGTEIRKTVRVAADRTASFVAPFLPMGPLSGWLAVTAPFDVEVLEGDTVVGTSRRRIALQEGPHTFELVNGAAGYREMRDVQIAGGHVTTLRLTLPTGTLHVNAIPWADVWIDGKSVGATPIGNLRVGIGTHTVVFKHPKLGERTVSTVVRADVATRVMTDFTSQ